MNYLNLRKISNVIESFASYIDDPISVPIIYFNKIDNVGDLIGPYLVSKITKRNIRLVKSGMFAHLLTVGSILGGANTRSCVWGSGFIDSNGFINKVDLAKIYAVRGRLSLNLINTTYKVSLNLPLGDPALLMPLFFYPEIIKKHKIGIVPHYADYQFIKEIFSNLNDSVSIIDVRRQPEDFITEILKCNYIISSSLHGLILSDAYKIPNLWVTFGDALYGGNWKFMDYYSLTDRPNTIPVRISHTKDLESVYDRITDLTEVSNLYFNPNELLDAFPNQWL